MSNPIKRLKNYNTRLKTVLNELEVLEDYEDFDYEEIVTDLAFITNGLELRRERLQRKGRRL